MQASVASSGRHRGRGRKPASVRFDGVDERPPFSAGDFWSLLDISLLVEDTLDDADARESRSEELGFFERSEECCVYRPVELDSVSTTVGGLFGAVSSVCACDPVDSFDSGCSSSATSGALTVASADCPGGTCAVVEAVRFGSSMDEWM